jgi:hypothetical protein
VTDSPADSPADAPTDSPADAPADSPADSPTDAPTDSPSTNKTQKASTGALTDVLTDAPAPALTPAAADVLPEKPRNPAAYNYTDARLVLEQIMAESQPEETDSQRMMDPVRFIGEKAKALKEMMKVQRVKAGAPAPAPAPAPADSSARAPTGAPSTNETQKSSTFAPTGAVTDALTDAPAPAPTRAVFRRRVAFSTLKQRKASTSVLTPAPAPAPAPAPTARASTFAPTGALTDAPAPAPARAVARRRNRPRVAFSTIKKRKAALTDAPTAPAPTSAPSAKKQRDRSTPVPTEELNEYRKDQTPRTEVKISHLKRLKLMDLKEKCRAEGLSDDGRKDELINRIMGQTPGPTDAPKKAPRAKTAKKAPRAKTAKKAPRAKTANAKKPRNPAAYNFTALKERITGEFQQEDEFAEEYIVLMRKEESIVARMADQDYIGEDYVLVSPLDDTGPEDVTANTTLFLGFYRPADAAKDSQNCRTIKQVVNPSSTVKSRRIYVETISVAPSGSNSDMKERQKKIEQGFRDQNALFREAALNVVERALWMEKLRMNLLRETKGGSRTNFYVGGDVAILAFRLGLKQKALELVEVHSGDGVYLVGNTTNLFIVEVFFFS